MAQPLPKPPTGPHPVKSPGTVTGTAPPIKGPGK
jgi:hypothetical protein